MSEISRLRDRRDRLDLDIDTGAVSVVTSTIVLAGGRSPKYRRRIVSGTLRRPMSVMKIVVYHHVLESVPAASSTQRMFSSPG